LAARRAVHAAAAERAIELFTIGFTRKTARQFFGLMREAAVACVIDTRLNRRSQLSGFAREQDLEFLVPELVRARYVVEPLLAPTAEMLAAYQGKELGWDGYERAYRELLRERGVERKLDRSLFAGGCLLCSEDKPHHCHRRLAAEYLAQAWTGLDIRHL
jgi:uncharacterized protein (DUF488 family)